MSDSHIFSYTELQRFRVGDLFKRKTQDNLIRVGWVTGLGLNPSNEVIFRVKYADQENTDMEFSLHPNYMYRLEDNINVQ
jgi:hypothetical protein